MADGAKGFGQAVIFTKSLRDGVRSGKITCSIRIWKSPRVKTGGTYPMDKGHIVIESIALITRGDITEELAQRSGFDSVDALLKVAQHGSGANVYLVKFSYAAPWD